MDFSKKVSKFHKINEEKYKSMSKTYKLLEYRRYANNKDIRSEFQRDRDRIIHSRAFRRLSGKTQVFNPNKGDHYRTRLTHSLEVSQISRTMAKILNLNEELTEAIALGHDIGHTPFGHVVERTLNNILKNNEIEGLDINIKGGFKHNFQSLHILDNIEMGRSKFRGLNLTLGVRDGIIKHTGSKIRSLKTGKKEEVYYETLDLGLNGIKVMDYKHAITIEGQIVALADEIAQSTHDLEDGIRSNIIIIEKFLNDANSEINKIYNIIKVKKFSNRTSDYDLEQFNILKKKFKSYTSEYDNDRMKDPTIDVNKLVDTLILIFMKDAILTTMENISMTTEILDANGLVNNLLVDNSRYVKRFREFISNYIYKSVVSSQEVAQSDSKSKYLIKQIFKAYYEDPRQLPDYILYRYLSKKGRGLDRILVLDEKKNLQKDPEFIRIVCDHIAGMTDKFAIEEYNNLYGPRFYI